MDGRYDYIPADSSAVWWFTMINSYSHHATDPVCAAGIHAFDSFTRWQ